MKRVASQQQGNLTAGRLPRQDAPMAVVCAPPQLVGWCPNNTGRGKMSLPAEPQWQGVTLAEGQRTALQQAHHTTEPHTAALKGRTLNALCSNTGDPKGTHQGWHTHRHQNTRSTHTTRRAGLLLSPSVDCTQAHTHTHVRAQHVSLYLSCCPSAQQTD